MRIGIGLRRVSEVGDRVEDRVRDKVRDLVKDRVRDRVKDRTWYLLSSLGYYKGVLSSAEKSEKGTESTRSSMSGYLP